VAFLIEEVGAQYSQSPAIAKGPLDDAASLIANVRERRSILLVPAGHIDAVHSAFAHEMHLPAVNIALADHQGRTRKRMSSGW